MADWSEMAPWMRAPMLGWGLGLFAGGFESVQLAVTLKQSMGFADGLVLGLTCSGLGGLLGVLFSIPAGLIATFAARQWLAYRRHALGMALIAFGLGVWFLVPAAQTLWEQQRPQAALAFALTPIGIGGVIWFNAVFWLRREFINDEPVRLGWWFWSLMGALVLSVFTGGRLSQRNLTTVAAIETDPDVLLITADALRRDAVFGEDATMPKVQALAGQGARYTNAITPTPSTLPAHSAIMTGLHPVRNKVLSNGHSLSRGYSTLAERLSEEGYATGAFVSNALLDAESGLDQGFQVYDDDFSPRIRALLEVQFVRVVLIGMEALVGPQALEPFQARSGGVTNERAIRWLERNNDRPAFAWVHLDTLRALPDERTYRATLPRLDEQIGALVSAVEERDNARDLLLIIAGSYGWSLGEHEQAGSRGLYDEVVRIPLIVRPVRMGQSRLEIPEQVRLMDLLTTVLRQLRLDPPEKTESGDLVKFTIPAKHKGFSSLLLGRSGASLRAGPLYGYRARNADGGDIKYLLEMKANQEELYNLSADPGEENNLAQTQPEVAAALRRKIQQELGMAGIKDERLNPDASGLRLRMIQAMGYAD